MTRYDRELLRGTNRQGLRDRAIKQENYTLYGEKER